MHLKEATVESSVPSPPAGFWEILRKLMHEMSQPLTSLHGSLEVALLGEAVDPQFRAIVEQALEEAERLGGVLASLREVLEVEDRGEAFQRVNWKPLIQRAAEEAAADARGQGARVALEPFPDAYVRINPPRVEACLRALFRRLMQGGPCGRVLRVGLAVRKRTASLLVCDGTAPPGGPGPAATDPKAEEDPQQTQFAWWALRRSIEVQGGRLEMEKVSSHRVRCRVTFPLASSDVRGNSDS